MVAATGGTAAAVVGVAECFDPERVSVAAVAVGVATGAAEVVSAVGPFCAGSVWLLAVGGTASTSGCWTLVAGAVVVAVAVDSVAVVGLAMGVASPLPSVPEVWAPPELLTVVVGLVLPGAVTVVVVSDPGEVVVSDGVVAVSEVCAPPELLTVALGLVVAVGVCAVDGVSVVAVEVVEVDEEEVEPESVGSAHATPACPPAKAAPTPRAAASTPTRPMYSA